MEKINENLVNLSYGSTSGVSNLNVEEPATELADIKSKKLEEDIVLIGGGGGDDGDDPV